jgi:hypothetical protein
MSYMVFNGNCMRMLFNYAAESPTGGNAGVGNYIIQMPSGYAIDTSIISLGTEAKYDVNYSDGMSIGTATLQADSLGSGGAWSVIPITSTRLVIIGKKTDATELVSWSSTNFPVTTTDLKVSFAIVLPVVSV